VADNNDKLFDSLIGQTLSDSYQLEKKIAVGGMGAVFQAKDLRTNETIAIKVLSPSLKNNPTFLKRFEREAKVGWMLSHPNIVKVYEFGATKENLLFIVMEYVHGEPLDDYLEKILPLTPKHCLEIIKPLASALEMAHKHSILHRDIKPANILINKLDGDFSIKLVDFGVVKLLESDIGFNESGLTVVGEVFGTPQYMAPEQLMEESIGPAADIYALGIIVYEMLTGELPFNSLDPKEVYHFKTKRIIPELSRKYSFVPKAFDVVVRKAIDYDPNRRYQNVGEFVRDFESVVEKYPDGKTGRDESEGDEQFSFLEESEEPPAPSSYQPPIPKVALAPELSHQNVATKTEKKVLTNTSKEVSSSTTSSTTSTVVSPINRGQVLDEDAPKAKMEKVLTIVLVVLFLILLVLIVAMIKQL
jgi:serine/threonine-protein kinase